MDVLNKFLALKASHLNDSPVFVMGNEAADLDSIVCCLLYAFFEFYASGLHTIPVVNIPREEFVFRAEVAWLFEDMGIKLELLTFIDEICLEEFIKDGKAQLFLVDNNKLCPAQESLSPAVAAVMDHHVDEGLYTDTCKHRRIIRPVGSAMTLVAEVMLQTDSFAPHLSPEICKLALAPILIDTVNLDPAHHKVTPADETVVMQLLELIAGGDQSQQSQVRNGLFNAMQAEKYNTSRLTVLDSLRRDYKAFTFGGHAIGICAVLDSMEVLMAKDPERFFDICEGFAARHRLASLLLMCAYFVGEEFRRDLILIQPSSADPEEGPLVFNTMVQSLEAHKELGLTITTCPICHLPAAPPVPVRFYRMANTAFARKKLAPLVASFF